MNEHGLVLLHGVGVGVLVGVALGATAVFVGVLVGVLVGATAVLVGVLVGVGVAGIVGVAVLVGVFVAVGVAGMVGVVVGGTAVRVLLGGTGVGVVVGGTAVRVLLGGIGVGVLVGGTGVDVLLGGTGVGVFVGGSVGVMVGVFVAVGVGEGGVRDSNEPLSQRVPMGRPMLRWSVATQPDGSAVSIAGLLNDSTSAWVSVGPPLFASVVLITLLIVSPSATRFWSPVVAGQSVALPNRLALPVWSMCQCENAR